MLEFPEDVRLALIFLRLLQGWNQGEMARRAGLDKSLISLYEQGKQVPSGKSLSRLIGALKIPISSFENVLLFVRMVRFWMGGSTEEAVQAATTIARFTATSVEIAVARTVANLLASPEPELPPEMDPTKAERLWERLSIHPLEDQRLLVRELPEFQSWGLCERLCVESAGEAAAADTGRALGLAELALELAARVAGPETWLWRLQGYVWAHVGNARRAAGDRYGAEEAFARARDLWEAGAPDDPGILSEQRFQDLQDGTGVG
ncbi:MAG TPA: helix-turn-helix transcriptional regulator [Thermoanaerobaculia bacterium]